MLLQKSRLFQPLFNVKVSRFKAHLLYIRFPTENFLPSWQWVKISLSYRSRNFFTYRRVKKVSQGKGILRTRKCATRIVDSEVKEHEKGFSEIILLAVRRTQLSDFWEKIRTFFFILLVK